ncbi:hypothetical protein P3W85_01020 [Cupriavidus basilensis]|uniref:Uncharacterized protein n=1 Tax=Cupriavidus basilensis TaxID=68895 RepID=A0ABT6AG16_9BURK|nr:hypothetical protein [Cupriavidus basilensis]MDF3831548.1 hypothetical protein [Cupriavidus basilensis]
MRATRKERSALPTATTVEGLTALLYHLAHATSQGQLDPDLVRKLGKHLGTEIDDLKENGILHAVQLTGLAEALAKFDEVAVFSEGSLLAKAASRLREDDSAQGKYDDGAYTA